GALRPHGQQVVFGRFEDEEVLVVAVIESAAFGKVDGDVRFAAFPLGGGVAGTNVGGDGGKDHEKKRSHSDLGYQFILTLHAQSYSITTNHAEVLPSRFSGARALVRT